MRDRPAGRLLAFAAALALLAQATPASAHDQPMGGSRWRFGKSAIVANIDLGPALLARIAGMGDGQPPLESMTAEQLQRLGAEVLQPYVRERLSVSVDGTPRTVKVDGLVRNGNVYTIWLSVGEVGSGSTRQVTIDYRLLFQETDNAHVNLAYGYVSDATGAALQRLFDFSAPSVQYTFDSSAHLWSVTVPGAGPEAGTRIASQRSVARPRTAPILVTGPPPLAPIGARASPAALEPVSPPSPTPRSSGWREAARNIGRFILLGVEHILRGYDHITFLLALIVVAPSLRAVLPIITAFTAAHSITLLLAALRVVNIEARLVESAIALSICYVAAENLFRKEAAHRWVVTFCFGLVHGFGFASVLQELVAGKANLVASVVSFNLGVELGQLLIFAVLLPLLRLAGTLIEPRKISVGASVAIGLLGCTWALERTLDLKFLPFA